MNRKNLIATAALALITATSLSAHAAPGGGESYGESPAVTGTSNLTRAEVLAEVIASKRMLSIDKAYGAEAAPASPSTLTRTEVMADLVAARADGRLDRGGEYSTPDSVIMAQQQYAQAQAAQLQARNEAVRLQALAEAQRQDALVANGADASMATPATAMESGTVVYVQPAAGEEMSTPPATPATGDEPSLSDEPADMPRMPTLGDAAMDRHYLVYLEVDDYGVAMPYDSAEQP